MPRTHVYSDGSCSGGIGGFGVVILPKNKVPWSKKWPKGTKAYYGSFPGASTNNIAELYAIYQALRLTDGDVTIYTDSRYAIGCLSDEWLGKWQTNGWKTSAGTDVANRELIEIILTWMEDRNVRFVHVAGHGADKWNQEVDKLANRGRKEEEKERKEREREEGHDD